MTPCQRRDASAPCLWISMLLCVSACAGSDPVSDGDAGPPIAAPDLCDELATLLCDAVTRCCGDADAGCVTTQTARCRDTIGRAALDPATGYNGASARKNLAEASRRLEQCDPDLPRWLGARDGFLSTFSGTTAPFGLCQNGQPPLERALACLGDNSCQRTPSDDRCRPLLEPSQVCGSDFDCPAGRYCEVECRPTRPVDRSCFRSAMCASHVCRTGSCRSSESEQVYCFLDGFDLFGVVDPPAL